MKTQARLIILLTITCFSTMSYAQGDKDERLLKLNNANFALRPSFSTIPANSWAEITNEINLSPFQLEIPFAKNRLSLRFMPIVGFSNFDEEYEMDWGWGGWGWNQFNEHVKQNVAKRPIKTLGGEFAMLIYLSPQRLYEPPSGSFFTVNGAMGFHPEYYYQTYKISGEFGYNYLFASSRMNFSASIEIGSIFKHTTKELSSTNYNHTRAFLFPKLSLGYWIFKDE